MKQSVQIGWWMQECSSVWGRRFSPVQLKKALLSVSTWPHTHTHSCSHTLNKERAALLSDKERGMKRGRGSAQEPLNKCRSKRIKSWCDRLFVAASYLSLSLLLQPSPEDAASQKAALHQARGVVRNNVCLMQLNVFGISEMLSCMAN